MSKKLRHIIPDLNLAVTNNGFAASLQLRSVPQNEMNLLKRDFANLLKFHLVQNGALLALSHRLVRAYTKPYFLEGFLSHWG